MRFGASSGVTIKNNLIYVNGNSPIWMRDGGSATTAGNVTDALGGWFVDAAGGDLHLKNDAVPSVIDQAVPLSEVSDDFDGNARPAGDGRDVGAHEYQGASSTLGPHSWGQVKVLYRG